MKSFEVRIPKRFATDMFETRGRGGDGDHPFLKRVKEEWTAKGTGPKVKVRNPAEMNVLNMEADAYKEHDDVKMRRVASKLRTRVSKAHDKAQNLPGSEGEASDAEADQAAASQAEGADANGEA